MKEVSFPLLLSSFSDKQGEFFLLVGLLFNCSVMPHSATPWTAACQASLSMGFSRQEYPLEWVAISFSYLQCK